MRIVVWKDVHPLYPHLLDQVLEHHGLVLYSPDRRLAACAELDEGDDALADLELGLHRSRRQGQLAFVGVKGPETEAKRLALCTATIGTSSSNSSSSSYSSSNNNRKKIK